MNILKAWLVSIGICLIGCNTDKEMNLKNTIGEKITFYSSQKRGYRLSILKNLKSKEYIHYAIQLTENGDIIYLYKTPVNNDNDISANGRTWYLVSDTSNKVIGANLFDREILGFHDSNEINFISSNKYHGKSADFLDEEKVMIQNIGFLMKEKKLKFHPFKKFESLFWFQYDL